MKEMKTEPSTIWGSGTAAKGFYLTKDNGGGPITHKFLKANGKRYQTPLAAEWHQMVKQNKQDAFNGEPNNGGYIKILNLRKSIDDPTTLYNIDLYYCCDSTIYENLGEYHEQDLAMADVYLDGETGLYQYINGLGRFSEANDLGLNYLWEGRLVWGEPFGFGRMISE